MSSIVIQSKAEDAGGDEVVHEVITLNILVREEEVQGFDQIEVWRSDDTEQGPYYEITASSWLPPRIPETAPDAPDVAITGPSVIASGTSLILRVGDAGDDIVVPIASLNPVSYADAAADITAAGNGRFRAYVTQVLTTGEILLVLEGIFSGNGEVLEVVGGDAAAIFSLPTELPQSRGTGKAARLNLTNDKFDYLFVDQRGTKDSFYRTRFRNRSTGTVSEFGPAFGGSQAVGLTPTNIVVGYLELVRGDGRPLPNRKVSVYSPTRGELVEGKLVTGFSMTEYTDRQGAVRFTLVRGVKYTVSISGTDIVRDIVAPEDTTVVQFPMLGTDVGVRADVFTVQVPDLQYAERRSI